MSNNSTRHYILIPVLTFLVIAAGLVAIWSRLNRVEIQMLNLRTQTTTEQVAFRLEAFTSARLHVIRQVGQQWLRNEIPDAERFQEVAEAIQAEFGSIQAITWVDRNGVIRWLVPEEANLPAKDRDLRAHPGLAEILSDAAATSQPRASGPLDLFQGGRGFGTYFPLRRGQELEGYINGVFRMRPLVRDCLQKGIKGDFYLELRDSGELLAADAAPELFAGSPYAHSHPVQVLDRRWTLTLVPTARTIARYQTRADEVFLAIGLGLAAAFAVMLKSFLQRQTALHESEERLRLAVENMPAMVAAFDEAGQFIVWNRHCERITGYSSAEIVGNRSARDLLKSQRVGATSTESASFGLAEGEDQEWLLTCKDGTVRTVSWSNGAPLQVPGWKAWGVGIDITERRKAEDALRLTQFAMDHAAVPSFWIREDASFFYVNEAACQSLGYTADELLRMSIFDIDPDFTREEWLADWAKLNRFRGTVTIETRHRRKDGSVFPVEITASQLLYKGQYYHFSFATDLSERKRAEAERLTMERALLETQKLESLGLLAGGVAHDFNNLLTAVMGSASLARKQVGEESPLAGPLANIESAAQQAADLARQLLAYSGKGKFVLTAFDLRSAVQETGQLLRVSIAKHVQFHCELGDAPLYVRGDPGQIRQIVMNLVINAAEAIGEEAGTVTLRTRLATLAGDTLARSLGNTTLPAGDYVCMEVSDDGAGMDASTQARVFEPFFTTKATGRGLGMAAVLGIVRGHHGTIQIQSRLGVGTTVTVYLPAVEPPAEVPEETPSETEQAVAGGGTVLVVDDENSVRTVAQIILEDSGYSVLTAEDGLEGVERFREHADEVRLVLLDMTMPRMDGREAMAEIRRIRPDVRVLLSSGYDEHEATGELAANRITGFIHKPYRADQLLKKIEEILAT